MQTQATTVGLYWRHMVVRCKLPQHDTSCYSKHDNTSRGNKKRKSKMVTYSWPWSMMSGPYPYLKTLINESKNQKRLAFRCFCAKPYLWKDVDNTWALVCEGGLLQHQTQVSGARYFHCLWAPELAQCIAVKKKWIVLWYLHINECSMRLPPSLCPNCVDPCRGSCEQPWWHVLTFWAALQLWRQGREHMKKWGFDGTWWRNGTCRTDAHRLWLCWYTAVSWKQKKIISDLVPHLLFQVSNWLNNCSEHISLFSTSTTRQMYTIVRMCSRWGREFKALTLAIFDPFLGLVLPPVAGNRFPCRSRCCIFGKEYFVIVL